jgi:hypothetical protein
VRARAAWRRNLGLKILSVLLALLLWAYVHGARTIEHEIDVPVHGINLPDSLVLGGALPRTAQVLVAGPAQEIYLHHLMPGAVLRLDLSHARPPSTHLVPSPSDCFLGTHEHLHVLRVVAPVVVDVPVRRRAAGSAR